MVKNDDARAGGSRSLQVTFFLEVFFMDKNGALNPQTGQFSAPFLPYCM
jgi:hypothetical protein